MPEDIVKKLDEKVMGVLGDINQDIRLAVDELEKQRELDYAIRRQNQAAIQSVPSSGWPRPSPPAPPMLDVPNPEPTPPNKMAPAPEEMVPVPDSVEPSRPRTAKSKRIPSQDLKNMKKTFGLATTDSELRAMMKLFLEEYRRMNRAEE